MSRAGLCPVAADLPEAARRLVTYAGHSNHPCRASRPQGDHFETNLRRGSGAHPIGHWPTFCRSSRLCRVVDRAVLLDLVHAPHGKASR